MGSRSGAERCSIRGVRGEEGLGGQLHLARRAAMRQRAHESSSSSVRSFRLDSFLPRVFVAASLARSSAPGQREGRGRHKVRQCSTPTLSDEQQRGRHAHGTCLSSVESYRLGLCAAQLCRCIVGTGRRPALIGGEVGDGSAQAAFSAHLVRRTATNSAGKQLGLEISRRRMCLAVLLLYRWRTVWSQARPKHPDLLTSFPSGSAIASATTAPLVNS